MTTQDPRPVPDNAPGTTEALPAHGLEHPLTAHALGRLLEVAGGRGVPVEDVSRAAIWAANRHSGQRRRSGEPYVTHCIEVATLVADLGGTVSMIAAALLHDTVEDTDTTLEDVSREFGEDVAAIVDGCTKVAVVHPHTDMAQRQAANLRKLFLSLAADPRVVVVKLCDRLHNLRTISALAPEKARRIGEETLAVHAPLAHRLGLGALKSELEDRSYAAADPDGYAHTAARIAESDLHRRLETSRAELETHLAEHGFSCEVSGRIKHLWSVHRKSTRTGADPLTLPDLLGLRIVCASEADCFTALGLVHQLWEPDLSRLRDYVNAPKTNGYQSLHTTVSGADNRRLEVQIRTAAMHAAAEHGAAAHHAYKHGTELPWVGRLLAWAGEDLTDEEYVDGVHEELGNRKDILTLTPKGEVVELPEGACVIDFAYAIHSAVGDRCIGARIDGRMVPLDTLLQSGQRVEIMTGQRNGPAVEWLEWVRTSKARSRIRAHVARSQNGTESTTRVPTEAPVPRSRSRDASIRQPQDIPRVPMSPGLRDVPLCVAGCCRPEPGHSVAGIVGRGEVRVHRPDCDSFAVAAGADPGRLVPVHWIREGFVLENLRVVAAGREGLLTDLSAAVGSVGGTLHTSKDPADGSLDLVVEVSRRRTRDLRAALRLVGGVREVG